MVWLIRPDSDMKMTYSIGRGLPKFTSTDADAVMEEAMDFMNFNNYDQGVLALLQATNERLRELYD